MGKQCLKSCFNVLKDNGVLFFTGIPDFKVVADAYLKKLNGKTDARVISYGKGGKLFGEIKPLTENSYGAYTLFLGKSQIRVMVQ